MNPQLLHHIEQEKKRLNPHHWFQCQKISVSDGALLPFVVVFTVSACCLRNSLNESLVLNSTAGFVLGVAAGSLVRMPATVATIQQSVTKWIASISKKRRTGLNNEYRLKISTLLGSVGASPLSVCDTESWLSRSQWHLIVQYATSQIELLNVADEIMETLRLGTSLLFGNFGMHWEERVERNAVRRNQTITVALPKLRRRLYQILTRQLLENEDLCTETSVITLSLLRNVKSKVVLQLFDIVERWLCDESFRSSYDHILRNAIFEASQGVAYIKAASKPDDTDNDMLPGLCELLSHVDLLRTAIFAISQDSEAAADSSYWWNKISELSSLVGCSVEKFRQEMNPETEVDSNCDTSDLNIADSGGKYFADAPEEEASKDFEPTFTEIPVVDEPDKNYNDKTLVYSALATAPKQKQRSDRSNSSFQMPKFDLIHELQVRLKTLPSVDEQQMTPEVDETAAVDIDRQPESVENERAATSSFMMPSSNNELLLELQQTLNSISNDNNTDAVYNGTAYT